MAVRYRKELDTISPYVPGKPIDDVKRELGLDRVIKLASNENPFGFSSSVREAVMKALDEVNLYPDGNATLLKKVGIWAATTMVSFNGKVVTRLRESARKPS